jgi:hypothetical protein
MITQCNLCMGMLYLFDCTIRSLNHLMYCILCCLTYTTIMCSGYGLKVLTGLLSCSTMDTNGQTV